MVATISLIILGILCTLARISLAFRLRPRPAPEAGRSAQAASPAGAVPHEARPQMAPAQADAPTGPVRGKVLLFPTRRASGNALVAMAHSNRALFVCWEPQRVDHESLRVALGEEEWQRTTPCLRVFDVTAGAFPGEAGGRNLLVALPEQADHCLIDDGIQPGHRYVVTYERRTTEGQHYLLSQSAPVWLPPDAPPAVRTLYRLHARRPGKWSGSP